MSEENIPHPLNAPGPFYVVDGCCTACGVPLDEAPELFAYTGDDHCYVKRQPRSSEEIDHALGAIWAQEFRCIRYRGDDPEVIRRLAENGDADICDAPIPTEMQPVFRNHVTFDSSVSLAITLKATDLASAFQEYLLATRGTWLTYRFTPMVQHEDTAAFSFAWFENNYHPIEFCTINLADCRWLVHHSLNEKIGSRGVSRNIDEWLRKDGRFSSIRWYTERQWNESKQWQPTPM